MKRSELITELNRMTLRYNLTWSDIKSDADKAIHQVNNFLGTDYPMLSKIMLSDNSEYVERVDDEDVPIIKDVYFYSVIIPFMAMEILARDEEFTTIFSKYQQEFMQGRFQMFSNEFNHIPDRYKRGRVEGVFFPSNNRGKR